MKLAFYYHIPILVVGNDLRCPSFLGVFLDELAKNCSQLFLVMHTMETESDTSSDYTLQSQNITLISLGKKTPIWHRSLFSKQIIEKSLEAITHCDAMIVRAPSPLAPHFNKYVKHTNVYYMIVGDYAEGAQQIGKKGIKAKLLSGYFEMADRQLRAQFPTSDLFVNSPQLYEKYESEAKSIELIKTTTLQDADYYENNESTLSHPIELLYTGRIDFSKGLKELVAATAELIHEGYHLHLNIVGWEENARKTVEKTLIELAEELHPKAFVTFHGKKKLGAELNEMYRKASVYVIPSYYEGFPRTIWEAMANSCPVIASRVGAIPYYLQHNDHALLIEPKSTHAIKEAIVKLLADEELRLNLIKNGYTLSRSVSLREQTKRMIDIIIDKNEKKTVDFKI
jgi:glycosyltransferase involved in cell wall biosynthesis